MNQHDFIHEQITHVLFPSQLLDNHSDWKLQDHFNFTFFDCIRKYFPKKKFYRLNGKNCFPDSISHLKSCDKIYLSYFIIFKNNRKQNDLKITRKFFSIFSNKAVVLFVSFFKQASPFEVGIILEKSITLLFYHSKS